MRIQAILLGAVLIGAFGMPGWSRSMHASALPTCRTAQLHGSIGAQNGAAGSIITTIVLKNVGRAACVTQGYPGVSLVDRQHKQIGNAAKRVARGPALRIVLQPGGSASALVRTLNPGVGTTQCLGPSVALRIYPPDQRSSLLVSARLSECLNTLEVTPLVAGTTGS